MKSFCLTLLILLMFTGIACTKNKQEVDRAVQQALLVVGDPNYPKPRTKLIKALDFTTGLFDDYYHKREIWRFHWEKFPYLKGYQFLTKFDLYIDKDSGQIIGGRFRPEMSAKGCIQPTDRDVKYWGEHELSSVSRPQILPPQTILSALETKKGAVVYWGLFEDAKYAFIFYVQYNTDNNKINEPCWMIVSWCTRKICISPPVDWLNRENNKNISAFWLNPIYTILVNADNKEIISSEEFAFSPRDTNCNWKPYRKN